MNANVNLETVGVGASENSAPIRKKKTHRS
jgi:hypothetical protein